MNAAPPGMPPQMAMPPQTPPMPTPEQLEQDKLIAQACSWEEVSGILRSDDRRNYSIDIETDATAFEDEEAEKASRIEYVKAMTEMMQLWIPAIQGNPSLAPFAKELAVFASGAFKPGRQFEEQLGDAFDQIQNTPPQQAADPEAEKVKAELAMKAQEMQMRQQEQAQNMQMEQAKNSQAMAQSAQEFALKTQGQQAELAFKEKELALKERELALKMRELEIKQATLLADARLKQRDSAMREQESIQSMVGDQADRAHAQQMSELDMEGRAQDRELKREQVANRPRATEAA